MQLNKIVLFIKLKSVSKKWWRLCTVQLFMTSAGRSAQHETKYLTLETIHYHLYDTSEINKPQIKYWKTNLERNWVFFCVGE